MDAAHCREKVAAHSLIPISRFVFRNEGVRRGSGAAHAAIHHSIKSQRLRGPRNQPCLTDKHRLEGRSAIDVKSPYQTLVSDGEQQKALFYSTSRDGKTFSPRARVPTAGVTNPGHPQMVLTPDEGAAIVWDEMIDGVRRISMTARLSQRCLSTSSSVEWE